LAHVDDCRLVQIRTIHDERGSISFAETGVDFDFPILRAYWTYGVPPGASRAGHAHLQLHQLYVAVTGAFDVSMDDGTHQRTVRLTHPGEGLLMTPGIWRELHHFTPGAGLLVLASALFDEADYIREHADFMRWVNR